MRFLFQAKIQRGSLVHTTGGPVCELISLGLLPSSMRGLRGPPCGLPHSLKHRMETTHLGPTGAPSAGVDGLWAICAPSVNFCSFIGHQVAKKRPCTSQSNFRRALGETPALIAHGDHSIPRPWLTGSHLLSLSSPARVPRPPLLRPARP